MFRSIFLLVFLLSGSISQGQVYFPDSTFQVNGISLPNTVTELAYKNTARRVSVMPDGKIVMYGIAQPFGDIEVIRLMPDGTLDPSFSQNGYTNIYISGITVNEINGMKVLDDGRIYLVGRVTDGGSSQMRVWALNADGSTNTTFGNNGIATASVNQWTMNEGTIGVQSDGKIVLAGNTIDSSYLRHCAIRLNSNGTVDNSYGQSGHFISPFNFINYPCINCSNTANEVSAMAIQTDNKLLVAGSYSGGNWGSFFLARYDVNGQPDNSFSTDGIVTLSIDTVNLSAKSLHVDNNGNIYVVGVHNKLAVRRFVALKYNNAGVQDMTYGVNGLSFIDSINWGFPYSYVSSMLQDDGKLLLAGTRDTGVNAKYAVRRMDVDGSNDAGFCNNGLFTLHRGMQDICTGGALQPNGRILLIGGGKKDLTTDTSYAVCIRITDSIMPQHVPDAELKTVAMKAYPNPVIGGSFTLEYHDISAGNAVFQLADVTGKIVRVSNEQLQGRSGKIIYKMPPLLPLGVYYLNVQTTGERATVKLTNL